MIPRYSIYQGPGRRCIAISEVSVKGEWTVKSGVKGKRLRSIMVPTSSSATFDEVKASYIPEDYDFVCTSLIDAFGEPVSDDAPVYYWEAKDVDVGILRLRLTTAIVDMQASGVSLDVVDDMSGLIVDFGKSRFGLTRSVTPGCISYEGSGAGILAITVASEVLCLIALLSDSLSISLADAAGTPLTRGQVLNRCSSSLTDEFSAYLKESGYSSLNASLRKLSKNQVTF